jgi:hypothetical protein
MAGREAAETTLVGRFFRRIIPELLSDHESIEGLLLPREVKTLVECLL